MGFTCLKWSTTAWCATLALFVGLPQASAWASDSDTVRDALERLRGSETGKEVLEQALRFWQLDQLNDLTSVIQAGSESKTDAVLTRRFDPNNGHETRERSVLVYLRLSQAPEDVVLDMAHELVHATARAEWDPYDPLLTPGKYIHAAIEGRGGEVDAVATECHVAFELYPERAQTLSRCSGYLAAGTLSKEKVREDFYRVGKWMPELKLKLGSEMSLFPVLQGSPPKLYSSTGHAPYPVALFREYSELTRVACENSRRRAPASIPDAFLTKRCQ